MAVNDCVDYDRLFQIAADLEGHPDNAAPAVFGGLTANMKGTSGWISRSLPIHESLRFTALIPDAEISTDEARRILPASYSRAVAAANAGKAVLMREALESGDLFLLREAARDEIHEPYRRTLIPDFDLVKKAAEDDCGGVMVISGSGSTCLLIADAYPGRETETFIRTLPDHWDVKRLAPGRGAEILGG
jgi:homoserine kinase